MGAQNIKVQGPKEPMSDAEFLKVLEIAWPFYDADYQELDPDMSVFMCFSILDAERRELITEAQYESAKKRICDLICGNYTLGNYLRYQCGMKNVTNETCYTWWKTYIADLRKRVTAEQV